MLVTREDIQKSIESFNQNVLDNIMRHIIHVFDEGNYIFLICKDGGVMLKNGEVLCYMLR
jgi:hypothetical protein